MAALLKLYINFKANYFLSEYEYSNNICDSGKTSV
jgi:hypothetical protein